MSKKQSAKMNINSTYSLSFVFQEGICIEGSKTSGIGMPMGMSTIKRLTLPSKDTCDWDKREWGRNEKID